MAPWLALLEAYAVQALLRSPAFHRGVEKVAKGVHRIRHGIPPEELGGTKIDGPNNDGFLRHFNEEVQTQLGRAEAKKGETAVQSTSQGPASKKPARGNEWAQQTDEESADAAWQSSRRTAAQPPKQGFLDEYMGALKEQLKNGK